MAEERLRETFHVSEKDRVCPNCGAKGSIVFQRAWDGQADLLGRTSDVWAKVRRPFCERCRKEFNVTQRFEMVR